MRKLALFAIALLFVAGACGSDEDADGATEPNGRITTVDGYAAAVCELAATCPDISPTHQDIEDCPAGIMADLDAGEDLPAIQQFLTYSESKQDCIVACVNGTICDRFDVGLSAISGADATEPMVECSWGCQ